MRPVFIVGTPRTGTSLLYRTIILHPDFFVGEVCLEESRIFQESTRILPRLQKDESNPLYRYMLGDDQRFDKFARAMYPVALAQRIPDALLRKLWRWPYSGRLWKALGGEKIVREFFRVAKRARGKEKRIVEKTPSHLYCVNYMLKTFPKCKIICMIRHPIDVYTSYVKRYEKTEKNWLNISVDFFISKYCEDSKMMKNYDEEYENFEICKYERFTKETKKNLIRFANSWT